jgi:predicted MFS family arabinose efflux permease
MNNSHQITRTIAGGISTLILTMGIARFTYTPALPKMQEALGLGDETAGMLAAVNFAGYLSGALLASRVNGEALKEQLFRTGLILALICNVLLPLFDEAVLWSLLRYLSGLGSAAGMVIGTSLVLQQLAKSGKAPLIGVHFGGVGIGIVITALSLGGSSGLDWQQTWWFSALIGTLFFLPAWFWVRATDRSPSSRQVNLPVHPRLGRPFYFLAGSYFFAGGSFAVGTTFIIAVIQANPSMAGQSQQAWLLLGLAAAPSCYLWVRWANSWGVVPALILAYSIQTLGLLLPMAHSAFSALAGGLFFGFTFMGIVAMVLGQAGKLAHENPARLMGLLVTAYGVGQITGPLIAGQLMEQYSNPEIALWLATGLSAAGTLLAFGCGERQPTQQAHCHQAG